MSVYKSNCCPHCNEIIETKFRKNTIKFNIDKNFGNPLKICPYCKKEYLDDTIKEPALMSPSDILMKGLSSTVSALAASAVISILVGSYLARIMSGDISAEINDAAAFRYILPLLVISSAVALTVFKPLNLKSEVNASLERLKDKEYAAKLLRLNKNIVSPGSAYQKYLAKKSVDA